MQKEHNPADTRRGINVVLTLVHRLVRVLIDGHLLVQNMDKPTFNSYMNFSQEYI